MNNFEHILKEFILEKKEEQTKMYKVYIMGNWYDGRYFNYGGRAAIVPAKSEKDAIEFVKNHKKEIIAYYDQAKISGKRILPKDIEKNIWLDKTHSAKLYRDQKYPGTFHKFIKMQETLSFNESAILKKNKIITDDDLPLLRAGDIVKIGKLTYVIISYNKMLGQFSVVKEQKFSGNLEDYTKGKKRVNFISKWNITDSKLIGNINEF